MNRLRLASAASLPLLLATIAVAQNTAIVPPAYATQAGNSPDIEPCGSDRIRHVQYLDRSLLASVPANSLIKEVAYRRTTQITTALMERKSGTNQGIPVWQVRLGNYVGPVTNPRGTFPTSTTSGWMTVFTAKQVDFTTNFPPLPMPSTGLPAFLVRFPFDVPFQYIGAALGIDHYAYESVNRTYPYYMDGVQSPTSAGTVDLISGTSLGCPAGQNRAEGAAPNPGGGALDFYLFGAPAQTVATAFFGASSTQWASVPLPLSLAPTLPGCFVFTDLTLPFSAVTSTGGIAEVHVPVPGDLPLAGATIYGQWVVTDGRVNPSFAFATSDGLRFKFGTAVGNGLIPMSVVSGLGNNAAGNVGFVQPGRGPILQLTW